MLEAKLTFFIQFPVTSEKAKQLEAMDSSNLVQLKHNLKKEVPPEILQVESDQTFKRFCYTFFQIWFLYSKAAQMEEEQFLANQKTKEEESTFILQVCLCQKVQSCIWSSLIKSMLTF